MRRYVAPKRILRPARRWRKGEFRVAGWADMEQPALEAAREWTNDNRPAIRKWASRRVEDLERIVRRYREMDEEEELRR